jgi:hypothetical protein
MYERPPEPEPMRIVGDRIISESQYQREIWRANFDIELAQQEEAYRLQCLEQGIEYKTPAERVSPPMPEWQVFCMSFFFGFVPVVGLIIYFFSCRWCS